MVGFLILYKTSRAIPGGPKRYGVVESGVGEVGVGRKNQQTFNM